MSTIITITTVRNVDGTVEWNMVFFSVGGLCWTALRRGAQMLVVFMLGKNNVTINFFFICL